MQKLRTAHEVAAGVYMEEKGYPGIEPVYVRQESSREWLLCYEIEGGELELLVTRRHGSWDFEHGFFPDGH